MIQGQSSQRGILFADTSAPGDNAVYCCYQNGQITCLEGPCDELRQIFKSEVAADKDPARGKQRTRIMLGALLFMIAVVALVAVVCGQPRAIAGAATFAVVGAFPLISLALTGTHELASQQMFDQLKRNHGAEHAAIAYHRKTKSLAKPAWSVDELRSCSYIDPECGTVYMASILLWAAVAGIAIGLSADLGLAKTLGILAGTAVLLTLNLWFNPANPLKLVQLRMVSRPTDRELALAGAGMQRLVELTA